MIFIIAGNAGQAQRWRDKRGLTFRRARYVGNSNVLRGAMLERDEIHLVGTWYERPDLEELNEVVRRRGYRDVLDAATTASPNYAEAAEEAEAPA